MKTRACIRLSRLGLIVSALFIFGCSQASMGDKAMMQAEDAMDNGMEQTVTPATGNNTMDTMESDPMNNTGQNPMMDEKSEESMEGGL